ESRALADPRQVKPLTDIVWPIIRKSIEETKNEQAEQGTEVFVLEAAVLVDAGWADMVDAVWVVTAPLETVRARLQERRNLSLEDANTRINAQEELMRNALAAATLVIDNSGSIE